MPNRTRIILDTNFLMIPGQFKVDIFEAIRDELISNYKLQIVDLELEELNKIESGGTTKDREAVRIARGLIKANSIEVIGSEQDYCDDELVELSKDDDVIIATQDKELKKRIKEVGGKLITMRQKKYLVRC